MLISNEHLTDETFAKVTQRILVTVNSLYEFEDDQHFDEGDENHTLVQFL
jgi:hypothetical protein